MERKFNFISSSIPFEVKVFIAKDLDYDTYLTELRLFEFYDNLLITQEEKNKLIPPEHIGIATCIYDFVEDEIIYGNDDDWWYIDDQKQVHVYVTENRRRRYIELMDKKNNNIELSKQENIEIEDLTVIMTGVPEGAASRASKVDATILKAFTGIDNSSNNEDEKKKEPTKTYRTKAKAGDVAEVPDKMPIITNQTYQNAMTYNDDDNAYLQPLSSADGLNITDGKLMFEGLPVSAARLKHLYTKDNIEDFDLTFLRALYAVILNKFAKTWKEDKTVDEVVTIYYPDLAKHLGKSSNISRNDVETTINKIASFNNIVGITEKGNNILPVLVYMGEDREQNTIKFASPYMVKVIRDISKASIRKNKQGANILNKDGTPKMLPAYSYLPIMSLAKEKNKKAVEIVFIVITTIEQAGSHTPHISAKTIVERNQLLKQSIDNASRLSNKNTYLERAFTRAWKLLRTHTDILERYKNIQLPDPNDKDFKAKYIPTMSTLDMVFEFPHEGKLKD